MVDRVPVSRPGIRLRVGVLAPLWAHRPSCMGSVCVCVCVLSVFAATWQASGAESWQTSYGSAANTVGAVHRHVHGCWLDLDGTVCMTAELVEMLSTKQQHSVCSLMCLLQP